MLGLLLKLISIQCDYRYVLLYSLPDYVNSSGRDILHYNLTAHSCPIDSARGAGALHSEDQITLLLLDCTNIICVNNCIAPFNPHSSMLYKVFYMLRPTP